MHVQKNNIVVGVIALPLLLSFCDSVVATNGRLYDKRNQYHVTCRLTKEKIVEPFFGEDSVKCFYTCTDKDTMVVTPHRDFACQKQIKTPRGDQRDWRDRLKY